jgi:hypothetical protein
MLGSTLSMQASTIGLDVLGLLELEASSWNQVGRNRSFTI